MKRDRGIKLPRLTATEARALDVIASGAISLQVKGWPGGDPAPTLSLSPLDGAARPLAGQGWIRVGLDWAGARLYADFAPATLDTWVRATLRVDAAPALPQAWRRAALERAVQFVGDALAASGRGAANVREVVEATPPNPAQHAFLLEMHTTAGSLHAVLHADSLGLLLLGSLVPPGTVPRAKRPSLRVCLRVQCGSATLRLSQLRQLRGGDVILMARRDAERDGAVWLCTATQPGWEIPAQLKRDTLTILKAPMPIPNDTPAPGSAADAADDSPDGTPREARTRAPELQELPIRMCFDVGACWITLGELEQIQPGQTLRMARPATDHVDIRVGGARIGRGNLVDIDGRLGVRVASIHAPEAVLADDGEDGKAR